MSDTAMTRATNEPGAVCPHDDLAKTGLFGYWICRPCGVLIEFVRDDEGHESKRVMTIVPATAVPDAELIEALHEVLFSWGHRDFGNDDFERAMTAHSPALFAWLAQQEGRDGTGE